MFYFSPVIF